MPYKHIAVCRACSWKMNLQIISIITAAESPLYFQ